MNNHHATTVSAGLARRRRRHRPSRHGDGAADLVPRQSAVGAGRGGRRLQRAVPDPEHVGQRGRLELQRPGHVRPACDVRGRHRQPLRPDRPVDGAHVAVAGGEEIHGGQAVGRGAAGDPRSHGLLPSPDRHREPRRAGARAAAVRGAAPRPVAADLLREEPADLPELRAGAAGHHRRRAAVVRRPVPAQGDADGLEGGPLRAEGPAGHAADAARRHAEQAERGPQGEPRADQGRAGVPRQHGPRAVRPADDDPAGGDGSVDHHGRRRHQSGDGGGAADEDERGAGGDDPPAVLGRQPHRQQLCRGGEPDDGLRQQHQDR